MKAKKTVAQNLGENLKRIRTEKGVSRKDLADFLEITEIAVGQYERGERQPQLEKIFAAADFLKVSVASLTGENNFSDNVPNIEKIVDNKIFEYRLQRACQMASDFLDSLFNDKPNFDREGRIVIFTQAKVEYNKETGVVAFLSDSKGNFVNSVTFKSKLDFVNVMERTEYDALRQRIDFNAAFQQIVFGEKTPK